MHQYAIGDSLFRKMHMEPDRLTWKRNSLVHSPRTRKTVPVTATSKPTQLSPVITNAIIKLLFAQRKTHIDSRGCRPYATF
jgi:hypothetical protein